MLSEKSEKRPSISLIAQERTNNPQQRGGFVDAQVQEFRHAEVKTLMDCGIPLLKVDTGLGSQQKRAGMPVGTSQELRATYIPLLHAEELTVLRKELADEWLCVIFDGTTRVGEVMAVVVRYCTKDFKLQQCLTDCFTTLMTGAQMSGSLVRLLVQRVGPHIFERTIAAARDSCSTNGAALRSIKVCALPDLVDVLCFSHTLHNNCAKHMNLLALEEWLTPWFQVMSHSLRAKTIFWKTLIY